MDKSVYPNGKKKVTVTEIPVITFLPAVIREENGKRKFYDLTSPEEWEIDDVIGWVDTGDIWTILEGVKL